MWTGLQQAREFWPQARLQEKSVGVREAPPSPPTLAGHCAGRSYLCQPCARPGLQARILARILTRILIGLLARILAGLKARLQAGKGHGHSFRMMPHHVALLVFQASFLWPVRKERSWADHAKGSRHGRPPQTDGGLRQNACRKTRFPAAGENH